MATGQAFGLMSSGATFWTARHTSSCRGGVGSDVVGWCVPRPSGTSCGVLQSMPLRENRFGFEPEVTARVAAMGCRVYEMGISYHGRTYEQGKKIGWRDGVRAVWCILKHNTFGRCRWRHLIDAR